MPEWSLNGRRFLITGDSRGMGEATARALQARGARLALVDLDEPALARVAPGRAP